VLAVIPYPLFLAVDQSEELFTSGDRFANQEGAAEYFAFLHRFTRTRMDARLCISMRTEYKGVFDDELTRSHVDSTKIPGYFLAPLTRRGVIEAIRRPTLKSRLHAPHLRKLGTPFEQYGFQYSAGLVETIAAELHENPGPGGLLPSLQVLCQRLLRYTRDLYKEDRTWIINEADYRDLGGTHSLLDGQIEDALRTAATEARLPASQLGSQMDCWRSLLHEMVATEDDGRVTSARWSNAQFKRRAAEVGCTRVDTVRRSLSKPEWSVLRVDHSPTAPLRNSAGSWALGHDSIGLSLIRWNAEQSALTAERHVRDGSHVLRAAAYTLNDLFSKTDTPNWTQVDSFDDFMWDHQLPFFADHMGFLNRLGFDIKLLAEPAGLDDAANEYTLAERIQRLVRLTHEPSRIKAASLPRELAREDGWQAFVIWNLYDGYAIIGRDRNLAPVRSFPLVQQWSQLQRIVNQLHCARVDAYEEVSVKFLRLVSALVDGTYDPKTCFPQDTTLEVHPPDVRNRARDVMYERLTAGMADFVIGPAPTRALAFRGGYPVLLDARDLRVLINERYKDDPEVAVAWQKALATLFMHNTWQAHLPNGLTGNQRSRVLRLASVAYFTTQYVRESYEEFVSFAHQRVLGSRRLGARLGALPLDRVSIRNAATASYSLEHFEEHGARYYDTSSLSYYRENDNGDAGFAAMVYRELLELRCAFHALHKKLDHLASSGGAARTGAVLQTINELRERAWRHYRIFNFFDAHRLLAEAVNHLL
jgi:hypothetical protein